MSYNSNYEDSNVFTLGGMTTVGLTDCGLQCKVACGCNTANGWYRAVPDGNYTSRTSVKSYDFVIGDDGKLASSGTTLSSSGKSLSGSTKSLSASSGEKVTCYKELCPTDYYQVSKPDTKYFSVATHDLRYGADCYKVTGCATGAYSSSPNTTYFNVSSKKDPYSGLTCYYAESCKCNYGSIGSGPGDEKSGIKCNKVYCSDENSGWTDTKSSTAHYTSVTSSYCNTCYTNVHEPNYSWCGGSSSGYTLDTCGSGYYTYDQMNAECMGCNLKTSSVQCYNCKACPTKVTVGSCEVGTTTFQDDECNSGTSYYTAKRDKTASEVGGTESCSKPHKSTTCGYYTTCKDHSYSCPSTHPSRSCSSGYYKAASQEVSCSQTSSCTSKTTCYSCAACPTKVTVGSCEVGTTTFTNVDCNSGSTYYTAKRNKTHAEACSGYYTEEQTGMDCTKLSSQKCGYDCYTCTESKTYYCDVTGSLSCSGVSTTECTISLSIDPRDSGVTVSEEPSASVSYSCDCIGTSGSTSGNLGFNGGVGYFQARSFTVNGSCTSCSASITSASPNPISAMGETDSCVVSIGNISGWTNNGSSEPEDDVSWYTEVLDKDYLLSDGVNVWTNHISRACITGSTSNAVSINLNCTVSFRGGIDPNYPGGFSESSCSGGDYDDTVSLTLKGDGTNCEVVYETPCLVNEINCEKL